MRLRLIGLAALVPLTGGCAEMATGMMMYSDQLAAEQGTYYEDDHFSNSAGGGSCPGRLDYGHVNNQTYIRGVNLGAVPAQMTVTWNTGFTSEFYIDPGQASGFVYMTPSMWPSQTNVRCLG